MKEEWSIVNTPPAGHADVGEWAWSLFEIAQDEKKRLQLEDTWKANYKLYRGDHAGRKKKTSRAVSINLFFANVQRTVANITARNPVAEVVDLDGRGDGLDKSVTARVKKWWLESNQRKKIKVTAQKSEKYGITTEKSYWNARERIPGVLIVDPFAFAPAPGNWEDLGIDPPYVCHAFADDTSAIESMYGVKDVEASDVYSVLGEDREESRPITSGTMFGSSNHVTNKNNSTHPSNKSSRYSQERGLVVEVWVRDKNLEMYPDGIRVITVTNEGKLLLRDQKNPSINWELDHDLLSMCYLHGRFPFYVSNSYTDTTSIWGFSAAEQVGDLNIKIDEIFTRMINYLMRCMTGTLIIPPKSGITREMLDNKPGLVLWPDTDTAANGIRYLSPPTLPSSFFNILDLLLNMYDRIYAIQDADRGNAPSGIVAASAIVALQERNAVLIQEKINSIDYMVEQRGKCAISMWQNHGHGIESVDVDGEQVPFIGTDLLGRKFNYVVESGSTMPKTSLQVQEQAQGLYQAGAIDREALLEAVNFPGWQKIIERVGEGQLAQAMQILIQAGMDEEQAQQLQQYLMEPGQRGDDQASSEPQPGTPRAYQGEMI